MKREPLLTQMHQVILEVHLDQPLVGEWIDPLGLLGSSGCSTSGDRYEGWHDSRRSSS